MDWNLIERWSLKVAAMPIADTDMIIAHGIVSKMAKSFPNWRKDSYYDLMPKVRRRGITEDKNGSCTNDITLFGPDDMKLRCRSEHFQCGRSHGNNHVYRVTFGTMYVNDQFQLHPEAAKFIISKFVELQRTHEELERVALEAKRGMEENERKWNFIEKSLKLRRNEMGALEPVTQTEQEKALDEIIDHLDALPDRRI